MSDDAVNSGGNGRDDDLIAAARAQARSPGGGSGSAVVGGGDGLPEPGAFPGYEILREIHRGGQGVVYQAIQKATKRKVAIKVLREGVMSAGSRGRARFEREVEILGQLQHPNIVAIHDSGVAGGQFYYVMDYISGQTLDAWMSSGEHDIGATLRLFLKVCDAMNVAHLKGVIHRDLKPSNIRIDSAGEPHVLDFGLAKIATGEVTSEPHAQVMTVTGQFIGSLPWASPEQAEGQPDKIDVRTDVYSLGVVLYQMLTGGRFPYRVVGAMRDVLDNILRAEPARPSTVRRRINDEVETIVLKCLSKERERRYQSAGELGRDIQRYLDGEPIEAKRDSGWYVITKTLNRYRWQASASMAALVALVVFAIVMAALWTRATEAERLAEARYEEAAAAREAEAAARQRAETNFDAVRGLARTFMYEIDESIADLRGATPARELVLRKAREYLDVVRPGADATPEFLAEWADANERLGDLLSGNAGASVGDTAEAAERYAEAMRVRTELLAAAPTDAMVIGAYAGSLADRASILRLQGKRDEAAGTFGESLDEFDRAMSRAAGDAEARERLARDRARAAEDYAALLGQIGADREGDGEGAPLLLESAERLGALVEFWSARAARDEESATRLASASTRLVSAMILAARLDMERGIRAADGGDAPTARASFQRAISGFEGAEGVAGEAIDRFASMSASQPASGALRRGLLASRHAAGEARMWMAKGYERVAEKLGDEGADALAARAHETALTAYRDALDIAEELASSDASNLTARRDLALCLNKVANEARDLGRLDDAETTFARSRDVREELVATDPTAEHRRDLALAIYKQAQLSLRRAADEADGERARERLERAVGLYLDALARYEALAAEQGGAADSRAVRVVRQELDACRARLAEEID